MNKIIQIVSNDHTDVILFVDKIQYILEQKDTCIIGLDNGEQITSISKIDDFKKAIDQLNRSVYQ